MSEVSRRSFVRQTSGALAGLSLASAMRPNRVIGAGETVNLGCIGVGGMGNNDMKKFMLTDRVNIVAVCDVDSSRARAAAAFVEDETDEAPRLYSDYRKLLEQEDIDAVLVATPDHWHTIITMDACAAEKDVYVEKPCAHNVQECRAMAAAAKKHKRVVQHGTQQRSGAHFIEAREYVRSGKLGKIGLVRCWALPKRTMLAGKPDSQPPKNLDYNTWLGPAPDRPFNEMRVHYNWRFVWDYGTGDMGNWGVHWIDCALWTLDLEWPKAVSSSGGKFVHLDIKETPDTQVSLYDYDNLTLIWEQRLWSGQPIEGHLYGTAFYGDQETLVVNREGWWAYGADGSKIAEASEVTSVDGLSIRHMNNFIDCIKSRKPPAADIAHGSISAAVSLLGNVAYKGEERIVYDPAKSKTTSKKMDALLTRDYRKGYPLPKV